MIELYYWPPPNGQKITMFFEDAGLDYSIQPVNISFGDQFKPEFLAFSPNSRMPAIIDRVPADGRRGSNSARSCFTSLRRPAASCRPTCRH